jgi:hypothetical protein
MVPGILSVGKAAGALRLLPAPSLVTKLGLSKLYLYFPSVPHGTLQVEPHRLRNFSPLNTNCEIMYSYTDVLYLSL